MGEVVAFQRPEMQVISEKEPAKRLGLSRATLARMRKAGIGPRWVKLSTRRIGYTLATIRDHINKLERRGWKAAA